MENGSVILFNAINAGSACNNIFDLGVQPKPNGGLYLF